MLSCFPTTRRESSPGLLRRPSFDDFIPPVSAFFPTRRSPSDVVVLFSPDKKTPAQRGRQRGNSLHPVKNEVLKPTRVSERNQIDQAIKLSLQQHHEDAEPRFSIKHTGVGHAWADALAVLLEEQPDCDVIAIETKATTNAQAAGHSRYDRRTYHRKSWAAVRSRSRQTAFVHAARLLVARAFPQVQRLFANETDASATFAANILHPVIPILNQFIAPEYRDRYEIALFSEVYHHEPAEDSKTFVDYGIMVIDKPANHEPSSAHIRKLKILHPLVFNEVKRHDLSSLKDWGHSLAATTKKLNAEDGNSYRLLPQLLMYAHRWQCNRIYLTDYLDTIAFDIDPKDIEKKRGTINIAFQPCYYNSRKATSLYGYGARISIAFDAVEALLELGMVDPELGFKDQPAFDASKLRPFDPKQDFKHVE